MQFQKGVEVARLGLVVVLVQVIIFDLQIRHFIQKIVFFSSDPTRIGSDFDKGILEQWLSASVCFNNKH